MNLALGLSDNLIKRSLNKGEFGLEKESLRVDGNGFLSHTKHPFEEQRNITRDFCENQTELITDVFDNVDAVLLQLEQLQTRVVHTLRNLKTGKEFLWPFSNPPYVKGEDDIPVAQFEGEQKEKTQYRNYLAEKYGKRKMLFSGIHLNYSFADDMLAEEYQIIVSRAEKSKEEIPAYQLYKNHFYLQLAQKVTQLSWFIVYLTAASPVMDSSILKCGESVKESLVKRKHTQGYGHDTWKKDDLTQYASVRCGELGYWNDFIPVFRYRDLETYIQSIEAYVDSGQLKSVSELYYPVRLKPRGENSLKQLREKGINHIELRMLDVNPLSPIGLIKEDVEFLHYLMLYLVSQKDIELTKEEQIQAIINEKQAAGFDNTKIFLKNADRTCVQINQAALEVLHNMESFYKVLGETKVLKNIQYQKDKLMIPHNRYADRIRKEFENDYVKKGICLADEYAEELLANEYVKGLLTRQCV